MTTVRTVVVSVLTVIVFASLAAAQSPVGALAIDERQGDQYGWAVDYETSAAAEARALQECGAGCSVVLTFGRCAAYAADQDADSTAVGWAESFDSPAGARQAALSECSSRGGGSGCTVRVWGCNGPVVEEGLGLNQAARRQIQQGLQAAAFDPGIADGLFGPRTRAAIRNWQAARGIRATGYLDGPAVEALQSAGAPASAAQALLTAGAPVAAPAPDAGQDSLFWQSIMNSTDPADFEAYLRQFPNGAFRALAQNRLARLDGPASRPPPEDRPGVAQFSGTPVCTRQPRGVPCWLEITNRPGCYVWNPNPQREETVTWTGACSGSLGQGAGSLTWVHPEGQQVATGGTLRDGRMEGTWTVTEQQPDGRISQVFEVTLADGGGQTPGASAEPAAARIIGALASGYTESGGLIFGFAVDQSSAVTARELALHDCSPRWLTADPDCSIVTEFESCAAAAYDTSFDGTYSDIFGWATGPNLSDVRRRALEECRSRGGGRCREDNISSRCNATDPPRRR